MSDTIQLEPGIFKLNGGTAVIHVSPSSIVHNREHNTTFPVVMIHLPGKNYTCNTINILGPSSIKYADPTKDQKPFFGIASVIITTQSDIEVLS